MKKYLTFVVGFLVILGITSCTKEYYDVVPNQTIRFDIPTNWWQRSSGVSNQVYVDIEVPELTDYYVDQGVVSIAVSFDNDATYEVLPTTVEGVAYSVNYTTGFVTIYAEDPIIDPDVVIDPPGDLIVKITLSESDLIQ
ncbi:hypothetical protein [Parapedobacter sp. DT-150]|uniref:hypothetical protein n=1 Tax=Parapedobacter sp. DT-150 TaxID=3396162 RepID=UPI003F1A5B0E